MRRPILLLLLTLLPGLALAQPSIRAKLDRPSVHVGAAVQLTVRVETPRSQPGKADLQAPPLLDFQVLSQSKYTSYDSRRQTSITTLRLTLAPSRGGQIVIAPFTLKLRDREILSNSLVLNVSGGAPTADARDVVPPPDPTAFIQWEVDRADVFVGEQIEARLFLYVRRGLRVAKFQPGDVNLEGFWTQDRSQDTQARSAQVQVGGVSFTRDAIAHYQLFPIRSGALELPSFEAELRVFTPGGFNRRRRTIKRKGPPLPLQVKVLPKAGRPAKFSGPAVGHIRLIAHLDRQRIGAKDGVQLTIETKIEGLIHNVPELTLPELDGLRVFPPSTQTKTQVNRKKVTGTRRQTWLLRPERGGAFKIPAISLPYFDPKLGTYREARSRTLRLQVTGTPKAQSARAGAQNSAGDATLRSVHKAPDLSAAAVSKRLPLWVLAVLFGAPLGLLGLVLAEKMSAQRGAGAGGRAARRALSEANRALDAVGDRGDAGARYGAIARALLTYLEARLQRPVQGLTHAQLHQILDAAGVHADAISVLVAELENCDFGRFAPGADRNDALRDTVKRARLLLSRLEEDLK